MRARDSSLFGAERMRFDRKVGVVIAGSLCKWMKELQYSHLDVSVNHVQICMQMEGFFRMAVV